MKLALALLALTLISGNAHAISLTAKQESNILSSLDSYCGDTWCEGDYDYKFKTLQCSGSSASCRLSFDLIARDSKEHFASSCDYAPVKNVKDLLQGSRGADSLNDGFTEALGDCFEKAEGRFRAMLATKEKK